MWNGVGGGEGLPIETNPPRTQPPPWNVQVNFGVRKSGARLGAAAANAMARSRIGKTGCVRRNSCCEEQKASLPRGETRIRRRGRDAAGARRVCGRKREKTTGGPYFTKKARALPEPSRGGKPTVQRSGGRHYGAAGEKTRRRCWWAGVRTRRPRRRGET